MTSPIGDAFVVRRGDRALLVWRARAPIAIDWLSGDLVVFSDTGRWLNSIDLHRGEIRCMGGRDGARVWSTTLAPHAARASTVVGAAWWGDEWLFVVTQQAVHALQRDGRVVGVWHGELDWVEAVSWDDNPSGLVLTSGRHKLRLAARHLVAVDPTG